ncbi:hypothetical protein BH24ACT4_BH24ACT4_14320 [soil metagenome]
MDPTIPSAPSPVHGNRTGRSLLVVAGLFLLAMVATWSLLGPQRAAVSLDGEPRQVQDDAFYDYAARVPDAPRPVELAVGAVAASGALVLAILALGSRAGVASTTAARVVGTGSSLLAGAIVGYSGRIVTAGVVGANIGAGLVVIFGVPLTVALLVVATLIAARR